MKKIFLSFPLFLTILVGCIPDPVEISIPQAEPRLVLASQMLFDQGLIVQVSRSFGALEFSEDQDTLSDDFLSQILADSARLTLSHPQGTDTLVGIGQGFYLGLFIPLVENETYTLAVYDSATGMEVFAQTQVLPPAQWDHVSTEFVAESIVIGDTLFSDTTLRIQLSFEDLPGENYYMINLYRISQSGQGQPVGDIFSEGSHTPTQIYPDQLYTDELIQDTLSYSGFFAGDTVGIALSHISKIYYDYLSTRQRSGTSLFANLLQEPVNFPTNVAGGYGVFNLYLPNVQIFVLE